MLPLLRFDIFVASAALIRYAVISCLSAALLMPCCRYAHATLPLPHIYLFRAGVT